MTVASNSSNESVKASRSHSKAPGESWPHPLPFPFVFLFLCMAEVLGKLIRLRSNNKLRSKEIVPRDLHAPPLRPILLEGVLIGPFLVPL